MTAAEVLRGALERLGPNGEGWSPTRAQDGDKVCVALATEPSPLSLRYKALHLVADELGFDSLCPVFDWNDDPHTTWEDVHLVLKRALAHAESEGL